MSQTARNHGRFISRATVCWLVLAPLALAAPAQEAPVQAKIEAHVVQPARVDATPERIAGLTLPEGFEVAPFAEGLEGPRMLALGPDGSVYATRPKQGDVLRLHDVDGDGRADDVRTVLRLDHVHGIAIHDGTVYLATVHEVYRAALRDDGGIGQPEVIVRDLPDGGQHPNRTLAVGPDGKLYLTVGSLSNAQVTPVDERTATMLRAGRDGSGLEIFARGLRNTLGFGWHPKTGELWGMDHGIDWLGDDRPPEELNRLVEGAHYGWPYLWGDNQDVPQNEPPDMSAQQMAAKAVPPVLDYTAHSAPMQLAFYQADAFGAEYQGDAFVAMRGSWNRQPPSGYEVVRIRFDDRGRPQSIEPFLRGFLTRTRDGAPAHFGRLVGLIVAADGSLLVGDDTNGVIYRVIRS